jgi:DNA-binding NarL/FixJ family response regulator
LLKDASEAEVLDTVRAVHRGESRLSPAIARKVMDQFRTFSARKSEPINAVLVDQPTATTVHGVPDMLSAARGHVPDSLEDPLTDKEERILALLAQGKSNKQIGVTVFLAEGTVKNYISRIMDKLHTRTRTELAVRAIGRRG